MAVTNSPNLTDVWIKADVVRAVQALRECPSADERRRLEAFLAGLGLTLESATKLLNSSRSKR